ncbi:hypothetical protein MTR67_038428 [Solanum verrucosum]|uniref:Uncharacterized protein n=1 Tax=Solanum verrucosum TaxID=315347 RepID=A0AAF0UFU9_SOLVR|nr:hypothetical protein MTR67_038428 [Solanum verrucosum]
MVIMALEDEKERKMELEEFKKEKYVESDRPPFSIQQQQDPWLVMCDGDLPPLPECTILECLLSASPNDPECQVLFLIEETETIPDDDDENSNDDTDDENDEDVNPPTFYFCKPGYNEEFHKEDGHSIFENGSGGIWTVFKKKFYVSTFQTRRLLCLEPDNDSGTITITPMFNESPDGDQDISLGYVDDIHNIIVRYVDDIHNITVKMSELINISE